jgi:hypothetical protein
VILKMGVKEVLYRTKHFGWGTDTPPLSHGRRLWRGVPIAAPVGRPACPQAEPGQWRAGSLEGRTDFRVGW